MSIDYMNIEWDKVKKSPVPAAFKGEALAWYRGSGIKIAVFPDRLVVMDSKDAKLAERSASYTEAPGRADIARMATAMLHAASKREERDMSGDRTHHAQAPQGTPDFVGDEPATAYQRRVLHDYDPFKVVGRFTKRRLRGIGGVA